MVPLTSKRIQAAIAMKTIDSPMGSNRMRVVAMNHAKDLARTSRAPSIVYYRPIDDKWFVLPSDAPEPIGPTINVEVRP